MVCARGERSVAPDRAAYGVQGGGDAEVGARDRAGKSGEWDPDQGR